MAKSFLISGRVEGGKLKTRNLKALETELASWHDCEVLVLIEKAHATRSELQNKWYWSQVLKLIADHTGYSVDEMHELCKVRFNGKLIDIVDKDGVVTGEQWIGQSTSRLNKNEFGEYCERIRQWAAEEFDVNIPDPGSQLAREDGGRVITKGWLGTAQATRTLDRLVAENLQLDAEIAERDRREQNEAIVTRAIRNWFERSES